MLDKVLLARAMYHGERPAVVGAGAAPLNGMSYCSRRSQSTLNTGGVTSGIAVASQVSFVVNRNL